MPGRQPPIHNRGLSALHRYFRVELTGAVDSIPDWSERPCMFVMNHTALLGLEVYLLYAVLGRLRPEAPRIRTTVWPPFLKVPLMGPFYRWGGCMPASVEGAAEALRAGDSVLFLPEGPDATDVREELGPFHAGFLRVVRNLADAIDVPVVPLGWAGVDEANPWWVTTNRLATRLLMKPVMERFDFAIVPRPPLLRPSKVVFVAGEPMRFPAADLAGEQALRARVARVRDRVAELVAEAKALRRQRIAASPAERALHRAFRMHDVRWRRRAI